MAVQFQPENSSRVFYFTPPIAPQLNPNMPGGCEQRTIVFNLQTIVCTKKKVRKEHSATFSFITMKLHRKMERKVGGGEGVGAGRGGRWEMGERGREGRNSKALVDH